MRSFAISALFASTLVLPCSAQGNKADDPRNIQSCAPKLVTPKITSGVSLPDVHFRKGERYVHTPVITYRVAESGEVTNALVRRSSGVADIDQHALDFVRSLKFNKRRGCPMVDFEAAVTVDLR